MRISCRLGQSLPFIICGIVCHSFASKAFLDEDILVAAWLDEFTKQVTKSHRDTRRNIPQWQYAEYAEQIIGHWMDP